jgi:ribosomal protein L30/L7E
MKGKMILVLRIAGRPGQQKRINETFKRLKLTRKFTCILVDENDKVRMGMVESLRDYVAFGFISDDFVKELKEKRGKEDDVFHLHPPIGGFKKSSKVAAPKGILGRHEDIIKLAGRML